MLIHSLSLRKDIPQKHSPDRPPRRRLSRECSEGETPLEKHGELGILGTAHVVYAAEDEVALEAFQRNVIAEGAVE